MKTLDFLKINGKISDMAAIHAWVDKSVKYLMNGRYSLVIAKKQRNRSVAQNRLMWLWFTCIAQETGETPERIHDYYCYRYIPHEITDLSTGQVIKVCGHSSSLTTEAFTNFLNQVQADAATELGITLPNPDDSSFHEFEETYKNLLP